MFKRNKRSLGRSKINKYTFRAFASSSAWRNYQVKLRKQSAKQQAFKRLPAYFAALIILFVVIKGVFWICDLTFNRSPASEAVSTSSVQPMDQGTLQAILANRTLAEITRPCFDLNAGIRQYRMQTSIHAPLQERIANNIDKKYARHFALVAMEPETGKIVAMVSHDKTRAGANVCTRPDFPAASLFKIVTAAAAVELFEFNCNTPVSYNGKKYSLYKSQLKPKDNKYTNHISFADSFADSINPVFGKVGINQLKKTGLEKYAAAFGFNRRIAFDLPLPESPLTIEAEPYNWAEIACGFNRETLISPLHAAVLVSGAFNEGKLLYPTLVETVHQDNQVVYQSRRRTFSQAVSPETANILKELMHTTITEGTARNSFRSARTDPTLKELYIGGKTGSINNNPKHIKYDWFAGFAEGSGDSRKLAVAVLVAHKDYIGTRAAAYAKMAFKEYFKQPANGPRT